MLLHFPQQLAGTPLRAHPDLGRVDLQLAVLGLRGVDPYRVGLAPDRLNLVDLVRLGQRLLGTSVKGPARGWDLL
jgi:hypothetical protein